MLVESLLLYSLGFFKEIIRVDGCVCFEMFMVGILIVLYESLIVDLILLVLFFVKF